MSATPAKKETRRWFIKSTGGKVAAASMIPYFAWSKPAFANDSPAVFRLRPTDTLDAGTAPIGSVRPTLTKSYDSSSCEFRCPNH